MNESFAELLEESFANQNIKPGAILMGTVVGLNADMDRQVSATEP